MSRRTLALGLQRAVRPGVALRAPTTSHLAFVQAQVRRFESEAAYHPIADEALENIQDSIDEALDSTSIEYEVVLASGVLTLKLPPHGTWVINKQTPNRQIWWSSPLSGPKRYEYDEDDGFWFSTKDGLSLGPFLVQEIRRFYPELTDFEIHA